MNFSSLFALMLLTLPLCLHAQQSTVSGTITDNTGEALSYANVILLELPDSTITKVEVSGDDGSFQFKNVAAARYRIEVKYVGLPDYVGEVFDLSEGQTLNLGAVQLGKASVDLQEATVTASRAIVEVKSDRTVFNVSGTINAAGGNGLSLLRQAPGVQLNHQEDISLSGRSGVLIYINGKRSPLEGEALKAYLRNLTAEQIDRIDIITNPGAKYDAEGNAGIIDIRLKKNEDFGTNGTVSLSGFSALNSYSIDPSLSLNHRRGACMLSSMDRLRGLGTTIPWT